MPRGSYFLFLQTLGESVRFWGRGVGVVFLRVLGSEPRPPACYSSPSTNLQRNHLPSNLPMTNLSITDSGACPHNLSAYLFGGGSTDFLVGFTALYFLRSSLACPSACPSFDALATSYALHRQRVLTLKKKSAACRVTEGPLLSPQTTNAVRSTTQQILPDRRSVLQPKQHLRRRPFPCGIELRLKIGLPREDMVVDALPRCQPIHNREGLLAERGARAPRQSWWPRPPWRPQAPSQHRMESGSNVFGPPAGPAA
jgi:hypothetical protein